MMWNCWTNGKHHCSVVLCSLSADFCWRLTFSFLIFIFCFQGRKVHSHRPLPSLGSAGGELPCQAPLTAEEPFQAAHGTQSPSSPDWHSVRDGDRIKVGDFLVYLRNCNHNCFPRPSCRSDKLRWISALSRPHPEMDFSAAQGKE